MSGDKVDTRPKKAIKIAMLAIIVFISIYNRVNYLYSYLYKMKGSFLLSKAIIKNNVMYFKDTRYLYAFDLKKEKLIWEVDIESTMASPIIKNDTIYLLFRHECCAFDINTGEEKWSFPIKKRIGNFQPKRK